jgi:Cytochrome c/c1 heme lyase
MFVVLWFCLFLCVVSMAACCFLPATFFLTAFLMSVCLVFVAHCMMSGHPPQNGKASIDDECSSDRLDDANLMPLEAKQRPSFGQRLPLSRQRVLSSIPRGSASVPPKKNTSANGQPLPPLGCLMHEHADSQDRNAEDAAAPATATHNPSDTSSALPPLACPMHEDNSSTSAPSSSTETPADTPSDQRWEYPSPQMFYNAMRRKGYQPAEKDMGMVVAIHNAVNERTWSQIAMVERHLHPYVLVV